MSELEPKGEGMEEANPPNAERRHAPAEHGHAHDGEEAHDRSHGDAVDGHSHGGHGHSHGLVDPSIIRSQEGVKAVSISLAVLLLTTLFQIGVFVYSNSVALLADLIHNFGDALTALPLGIAFFLRSVRGEMAAGYFVVATIFFSALVALWQTIGRLIDPQPLSHLAALAVAGAVGFVGNEIAALVRLRAGKRLQSPALIADGYHARTDGFVSLGVIGSAVIVALGFDLGDPLIGLVITLIILRITWQSWRTMHAA